MSLFGRLLGRQKSRWPQTWQSYPGLIGDAAALWTVDLGAVMSEAAKEAASGIQ